MAGIIVSANVPTSTTSSGATKRGRGLLNLLREKNIISDGDEVIAVNLKKDESIPTGSRISRFSIQRIFAHGEDGTAATDETYTIARERGR